LASVIGLAPTRPGLKDRLLDLLCIHGLLAQAQELAPGVGIAPTSPPLQGGANLPQLPGEMARWSETPRPVGALPAVVLPASRD